MDSLSSHGFQKKVFKKRFLSPHPICTTFLSDGSHVPSLKMKTSQNIQLQKLMVPPSGIAAASSILGGGALKNIIRPQKIKVIRPGNEFFLFVKSTLACKLPQFTAFSRGFRRQLNRCIFVYEFIHRFG